MSLLQDNGTVKRSAAESKALMRRIYSKIDKDTTRDEMLKIMEMPQSGWFIEKVRSVRARSARIPIKSLYPVVTTISL